MSSPFPTAADTPSVLEDTSDAPQASQETPDTSEQEPFFPAAGKISLALEATSFTLAQLIHPDAPQVALAGRSNVGKSSLVNALANRKSLAKVSATPGKTRSINYYRVDPTATYVVDLPGYGYAKCSQEERNKWAALMEHYLCNTPGLAALILLLDARLPPQKLDKELAAFAVQHSLHVVPVLTKADKCNKKELAACKRAWGAFLDENSLLVTSSEAKSGMEELWQTIMTLLEEKSRQVTTETSEGEEGEALSDSPESTA